jgi:hypothetical protein
MPARNSSKEGSESNDPPPPPRRRRLGKEKPMSLYAVIDEEVFSLEWLSERDLDYVLTFERDGQRYQRKLGDCDREHIEAVHQAMQSYVAINKADIEHGKTGKA